MIKVSYDTITHFITCLTMKKVVVQVTCLSVIEELLHKNIDDFVSHINNSSNILIKTLRCNLAIQDCAMSRK